MTTPTKQQYYYPNSSEEDVIRFSSTTSCTSIGSVDIGFMESHGPFRVSCQFPSPRPQIPGKVTTGALKRLNDLKNFFSPDNTKAQIGLNIGMLGLSIIVAAAVLLHLPIVIIVTGVALTILLGKVLYDFHNTEESYRAIKAPEAYRQLPVVPGSDSRRNSIA